MTPTDERTVSRRYPFGDGDLTAFTGSGLSGACLWRFSRDGQDYGLRAWPPDYPLERLATTHRWLTLANAAGLPFVPVLVRSNVGDTFERQGDRLWEVTTWLPGRPESGTVSRARLESACRTLARLHAEWSRSGELTVGPMPAIERRQRAADGWGRLIGTGWQPFFRDETDPVTPWAKQAWHLLRTTWSLILTRLSRWDGRRLPLQPCHGDPQRENVLFQDEAVSGLIDYGAAGVDSPLADLARLIGPFADADLLNIGLRAYAEVRPLPDVAVEVVRLLDETGVVLSLANWLRWLYHDERAFADRSAVARRLAELVRRASEFARRGGS